MDWWRVSGFVFLGLWLGFGVLLALIMFLFKDRYEDPPHARWYDYPLVIGGWPPIVMTVLVCQWRIRRAAGGGNSRKE